MYKYLVFASDDYYPTGGMDDCILKTNDYNEATKSLEGAQQELDGGMGGGHIYGVETDSILLKREWDSKSNEIVKE